MNPKHLARYRYVWNAYFYGKDHEWEREMFVDCRRTINKIPGVTCKINDSCFEGMKALYVYADNRKSMVAGMKIVKENLNRIDNVAKEVTRSKL